jgi:hypothetical protein
MGSTSSWPLLRRYGPPPSRAVDTWWMGQGSDLPVCATCGRIAQDDSAVRLTWALARENGRAVWTCDLCCREHLRSIEGKVDLAWW